MKNRRNYYRILQVQPDATFEVIRASYKTIMRELKQHPDLGGDHWKAQILNEAYETLSNKTKRQIYDKKLFEHFTKKPCPDPNTGKTPIITIFCPFCKRPLARQTNSNESCPTCKSPLKPFTFNQYENESRRSIPRIKKSEKIYYYTTWPQKGKIAEMVDFSKEGIRFKCNDKLNPGMLIKISNSKIKGIIKIKNVQKMYYDSKIIFSIGAEFVSVTFNKSHGNLFSVSA